MYRGLGFASSAQPTLIEKLFRVAEIRGFEALCEPVVAFRQGSPRIIVRSQPPLEACEARGCAQFEGSGMLSAGDFERLLETRFCVRGVAG